MTHLSPHQGDALEAFTSHPFFPRIYNEKRGRRQKAHVCTTAIAALRRDTMHRTQSAWRTSDVLGFSAHWTWIWCVFWSSLFYQEGERASIAKAAKLLSITEVPLSRTFMALLAFSKRRHHRASFARCPHAKSPRKHSISRSNCRRPFDTGDACAVSYVRISP